MNANTVSVICKGPRHVERSPYGDSITKFSCKDPRVIGEVSGEVAIGPATLVLESLRQVPMVERAEGANSSIDHSIHHSLVVVQSLLIGRTCPTWLDTRPGDREAITLLIKPLK